MPAPSPTAIVFDFGGVIWNMRLDVGRAFVLDRVERGDDLRAQLAAAGVSVPAA